MQRTKKGLHLEQEKQSFHVMQVIIPVLTLKTIFFYLSIHHAHLSIFSTNSSRDCWNLLLTVGAWYFLVTVLPFLM